MIFTYQNQDYPVVILKKNNKNTYIRVNEKFEIIVTTSYLVTQKMIEKLLQENSKAIIKMLDSRIKKRIKDEKFLLFGKEYDLVYSTSFEGVDIRENKIYVKDIKTLNKYLSNLINETFKNVTDKCLNKMEENIPYFELKIRKMKSRWGVCNRKNNTITLNLDLYKYDLECLEYVIFHELCHFIHFDHSALFWSLVSKYVKDYKKIRKLLKE